MNRTQGKTAAVAGFCLLWALIVFATAAAAYGLAGDGALLAEEMRRCAPPEYTGLPDEHYQEMGRMIAGYLTGNIPEFQYSFGGERDRTTCFQPHEAAHMADCRGLISLAGIIRRIAGAAVLVLTGTGIALRKYRKRFADGVFAGFFMAAAVFLTVLAWGLIDFDGLFTTFHKIAFTNDGWLLDSRTDMLIRLMPTAFFMSMGIRVLMAVTAAVLVSFGTAVTIRILDRKREKTDVHLAEKADHNAG